MECKIIMDSGKQHLIPMNSVDLLNGIHEGGFIREDFRDTIELEDTNGRKIYINVKKIESIGDL